MNKLFIICIILTGVWSMAAELETEIAAVTIYPEMAQVQRSAQVQVNSGDNYFAIARLPQVLLDESVWVSLDNKDVRISDVKVETWYSSKATETRVRALEQQIADYENKIKLVQNDIEVLKNNGKFLTSIQAVTAEGTSQQLARAQFDAKNVASALDYISKNLKETFDQMTELEIKAKELQAEKAVLDQQMAKIRTDQPRSEKTVTIMLTSARQAVCKMTLYYIVHDVSWTPSYEIRALPDQNLVDLYYNAQVTQKSGEDWKRVRIALSTSNPTLGTQVPTLNPWYVYFYAIPAAPQVRKSRAEAADMMVAYSGGEMAPLETESMEQTVIRDQGVSVVFEIPEKKDISSGDEPVKLTMIQTRLTGEMSYSTVPKLSPFAYLNGQFENKSTVPLLQGNASVYVNGDYLGASYMKFVAPNEKFDLSLGVDQNIKVQHQLIKKMERNAGTISKKTEMEYVYKITLTNFKPGEINIQVLDQLPHPQHEDIRIQDVTLTPEPGEWKKDSDELKWNLKLAPREKKEISLGFVVSYPRDAHIIGLW